MSRTWEYLDREGRQLGSVKRIDEVTSDTVANSEKTLKASQSIDDIAARNAEMIRRFRFSINGSSVSVLHRGLGYDDVPE